MRQQAVALIHELPTVSVERRGHSADLEIAGPDQSKTV